MNRLSLETKALDTERFCIRQEGQGTRNRCIPDGVARCSHRVSTTSSKGAHTVRSFAGFKSTAESACTAIATAMGILVAYEIPVVYLWWNDGKNIQTHL